MSVLLSTNSDAAGVSAALTRGNITAALLLEMQFVSGTVYVSNWNVPFTDTDDVKWEGLGDLVSLGEMSGGDDLAPYRDYILGLPKEIADYSAARVPELIGARSDYLNQDAILRLQLFDRSTLDTHGRPTPVGSAITLDKGLMSRVSASYSPSGASITMTVESGFSRKSKSVPTYYTDRDQSRLYSGDKGCAFTPEVADTEIQMTDW